MAGIWLAILLLAQSASGDVVYRYGGLTQTQSGFVDRVLQAQRDFFAPVEKLPDDLEIPIWLLDSAYEFRSFARSDGITRPYPRAYFSPRLGWIVTYRDDITVEAILHEVQHALHRHLYRDPFVSPLYWLNEGLSEFFQKAFVDPDGNILKFGLPNGRAQWVRQTVLLGWFDDLDLVAFLTKHAVGLNRFDLEKDQHVRMVAWSVVTFFMADENRKAVFQDILADLTRGVSFEKAVENSYDGGADKLHRDWIKFLRAAPGFIQL